MATTTTAKKDPEKEDLEEQLKVIRDDVAKLTGLLKNLAESKTAEARDQAMARAQDVLDTSERAYRSTRARAEAQAESLEAYVADKPLQSTLIALGIGLVLGRMSRH